MIVIDILNPEEVAKNHAGKFKIMVARALGINLKKRIEVDMAQRLQEEMEENGLRVDVWVEKETPTRAGRHSTRIASEQ